MAQGRPGTIAARKAALRQRLMRRRQRLAQEGVPKRSSGFPNEIGVGLRRATWQCRAPGAPVFAGRPRSADQFEPREEEGDFRAAVSGASELWTEFSPTESAKSLRIVPGAALAGLSRPSLRGS